MVRRCRDLINRRAENWASNFLNLCQTNDNLADKAAFDYPGLAPFIGFYNHPFAPAQRINKFGLTVANVGRDSAELGGGSL